MRRTDNNLSRLVATLRKTTMLVINRGTRRHFDVKWATPLVVLTLFVFLVEPNVIGQGKPVEDHLAEIKKRIDDISSPIIPDTPDGVTLHAETEWHCARPALSRTGAAIEWVAIREGGKKTITAATKAVANIVSLGGATRAGLALDIFNAYRESNTVEQFRNELAKIAFGEAFGKGLEKGSKKIGRHLDETQEELVKKFEIADKIWEALAGAKEPVSVEKIWPDPKCGNINIKLWVTTEGVTKPPPQKAENLVQKNCEKICADDRKKWERERSALNDSERAARTQEENLKKAKLDLDDAQKQLNSAQVQLSEARKTLDAANKRVKFVEDLLKQTTDVKTQEDYQRAAVNRNNAEQNLSKWNSQVLTWQSESKRLTGEIDRLTKSSSEARASADKQLKAAKDAENAYRMCLKNCYDERRKLGSDRDKEDLKNLQDPLKTSVEELLAGYVPPTPPEPPTESKRAKKVLHFDANGDCHCQFPENYTDNERLGSFGVVGTAELVPQNPELGVEGKTIAINYKLGAMKFDVVAKCGCKTPAKSETAIPPETRTQTQSAKPTSQPEHLPSGMERLNEVTAASFYSSPVAPPGAWCPCCACCWPYGQPNYASIGGVINVNVRLCLAMDKVGIGQAIHIAYDRQHYDAETYLQWNASGGPELKVDLEVQRPGSAAFEKLLAGSEAGDGFLFATKNPGTYVFRATAKDSSGRSSFNTLALTFPVIESEAESIPR